MASARLQFFRSLSALGLCCLVQTGALALDLKACGPLTPENTGLAGFAPPMIERFANGLVENFTASELPAEIAAWGSKKPEKPGQAENYRWKACLLKARLAELTGDQTMAYSASATSTANSGNAASKSTPQSAANAASGNGLAELVGTWNLNHLVIHNNGAKDLSFPVTGCQHEISDVEMISTCKNAGANFVIKYALRPLAPGTFLSTVTSTSMASIPVGKSAYMEYSLRGDALEMTGYVGAGKEAKDQAAKYERLTLQRVRGAASDPQAVRPAPPATAAASVAPSSAMTASGNGMASLVGTWTLNSLAIYKKTGEKEFAMPGNGCQYEIGAVEMTSTCKGGDKVFVNKFALKELGSSAFLSTVTSSKFETLPVGRVSYMEYSINGDSAEVTSYVGASKDAKDQVDKYTRLSLQRAPIGNGDPQAVRAPPAALLLATSPTATTAQTVPSTQPEQPTQTALPLPGGGAADMTATVPQGRWDDKRCLAEMGRINSDHMERHIPASVKGQTDVQALQLEAKYSAGPMKLLFGGPCAGYRTASVYVASAMDTIERAERAGRTGVAEPDIRQMKSRMPGKLSDAECQAKITEIHKAISVFGAGARNANDTLLIAYREQGIPQKLLFEGPCSSHPQASSYLATANKIITDAERVLGVKVGVTKNADNRSAPADYSDRQKIIASSGEPAHHCLSLIPEGLFGGFSNSCSFKVYYTYCAFHPKKGAWVDSVNFNCESSQYTTPRSGGQTVGPNGQDANHTRGAEKIFWFGCKAPAHPYLVKFNGSGLIGMCRPESS